MEKEIYDVLYHYTKALSVALGYRDQMTRLHSERVRSLSLAIGRRCSLDGMELEALGIGASFHDIGKIGIPDHVLLKPAKFDAEEWEVMKRHSEIGEKIMLSTELGGSQHAARVIRHHHEHYDGTGYPDRLSGEAVPVCSRIISIADSYDAMAVTRSYHMARKHEEIMAILEEETGGKHDPQLMAVFSGIIEKSEFRA
ncbi:MAG TPA: HD domain-containing protein [Burkholderiales bacterium]|nr:HD domain-containing protein [Burkholderiales bacterium]